MDKNILLPWNISVVSSELTTSSHGNLSNALLYGDKVTLLPLAMPQHLNIFLLKKTLTSFNVTISSEELTSILSHQDFLTAEKQVEGFNELLEQLNQGNIPVNVPIEMLFKRDKQLPATTPQILLSASDNSRTQRDKIRQYISQCQDYYDIEAYSQEVQKSLNTSHGLFIDDSLFASQRSAYWNAYDITHKLMEALSKTLLPDVGNLPIAEIAGLRDKVKDELDPMRAELLRMTEDLRIIVDKKALQEEVVNEAANLIKTRVEPVVREASSHIEKVMESKLKRFLVGVPKWIGITSFGLLDPTMFGKAAITQSLDMANKAAEVFDVPKPPTATARFVLEIRRNIQKNSSM